MLETMAHLTHDNCAVEVEYRYQDRAFDGHASVTELEICREFGEYEAHSMFCEEAAERQLAAAFRSTYETDIQHLEESLRVGY